MTNSIIGNKSDFAVEYAFFDDTHETEIAVYIRNNNILAFKQGGYVLTTKWNLDELVEWLRNYLNTMEEDPYPVQTDGRYAAEKDINARDFDSENIDDFDAYYDELDAWNVRHRWHPASSGAILADVYFQLVGDSIEVSWNNTDCEEEVEFVNPLGGSVVSRIEFEMTVDGFLKAYADHWFRPSRLRKNRIRC
ncbi:MAG: hypothetical protein IKF50_00130 [Clostridia bacterium]|nr:hypothetical protein [Clostridia bacterium]